MSETAYATMSDFALYGLPSGVGAGSSTITAHLLAASRFIDEYIAPRVTLPLTSWTSRLTQLTCQIAAYTVLTVIGFNPESPNDKAVESTYDKAVKYLEGIREGQIQPTFTALDDRTQASSDPARGFIYPDGRVV